MDFGHSLAAGNTAVIYRIKDKAIKVFKEGFPKTEAIYESKKQVFFL